MTDDQTNSKTTRLSEDLKKILEVAGGKPVTFEKLILSLHGRASNILIIILSLPFCTPFIDILFTGLSTVFGMVVMFMGAGMMLGKQTWVPKKYLHREIPYASLEKTIKRLLSWSVKLETIIHPRFFFLNQWAVFKIVNGAAITLLAFLLALPLPIPLTNFLPAISIVILAAGLVEEDGLFILGGYLMSAVTAAYFIFFSIAGKSGIEKIW